jgi:hypothetical protein
MASMQFSVRAGYAVRALIELAGTQEAVLPAEQLAREQAIPGKALEAVMTELRPASVTIGHSPAAPHYKQHANRPGMPSLRHHRYSQLVMRVSGGIRSWCA